MCRTLPLCVMESVRWRHRDLCNLSPPNISSYKKDLTRALVCDSYVCSISRNSMLSVVEASALVPLSCINMISLSCAVRILTGWRMAFNASTLTAAQAFPSAPLTPAYAS